MDRLEDSIKDSYNRIQHLLEKQDATFSSLHQAINELSRGIAKGFAASSAVPSSSNSVAVIFITVILSLATIFGAVITSNASVANLESSHVQQISDMKDAFQVDRTANLSANTITALNMINEEIRDLEARTLSTLSKAENTAMMLHEIQEEKLSRLDLDIAKLLHSK